MDFHPTSLQRGSVVVTYLDMRMKKRTFALFIIALVLVSVYWNLKQTDRNTHSGTSNTEVQKMSSKFEQQIPTQKASASIEFSVSVRTTTKLQHAATRLHISTKTSKPTIKDYKFKLQQKLLELERKLNQSLVKPKVIFIGPSSILEKEIPLYKPALLMHGHIVETILQLKKTDNEITELSGLMCYIIPCWSDNKLAITMNSKVSHNPGLIQVFRPPQSFCYTMSQTLDIPALSQSPLSVPCYVLPPKPHVNLHKRILESSDNNSLLLVQSSQGLGVVDMRKDFQKRVLKTKGILQVVNQPLLLNGLPVIMKLFVVVTSIFPLRIYRHLDGQASVITLRKGELKETWTLQRFISYLSEHNTNYEMEKVWSEVERTVVSTLMVSESLLTSKDLDRTQSTFQLLEFHFTFNSSLHPLLLEVKVPEPGTTFPRVANDTIDLLFAMTSSYDHVTDSLVKLKDIVGVKGMSCHNEHRICLSERDLIYLLESHRESTVIGRFKKLYPTHDSSKYHSLLDQLRSSSVDMVTNHHHGTTQLHDTLLLMENYGNYDNQGTDGVMRQNVDKRTSRENARLFTNNRNTGVQRKGEHETRRGYWETDDDDDADDKEIEHNHELSNRIDDCDDDATTVPVLTDIIIEPKAPWNPSFDSDILEYEVVFPFDVMIVKVWGKTSTCRAQARVNSKTTATKRPINYSLGVGWNTFVVHLIDLHPRPSVVSTYKINIYRKPRATMYFDPLTSPHEMCSLKQDCDLKTFPKMPCGPQILTQKTFQDFTLSRKDLPYCDNGYSSGSWVLPCVNCSRSSSCYWNDAIWTPNACQHKLLTTKQMKTCLAKKKILFVGDSTNRGMMYYLMEKINGSLRQWEKTHSMKGYSSALNDHQTSVSFAYYPQFWLPPDRKPVFLKALHHLMAKFMPLHNSTDTILVVGGVQWLLPSHVIAVKTTLNSLGLSGIKVLIKSLGSGFHLPVPGFVQLDKEGQRKVYLRNQLLIKTAQSIGFEVIDTHTMTVSRYKEFLMGKCGCHFHKVVNVKSQRKELMDETTLVDNETNGLPRYHVIGRINKAYADIMISSMCS